MGLPGSLGGLEVRSVDGTSGGGDIEPWRNLGGGRGGPDERSARAAASALTAMAPSLAALLAEGSELRAAPGAPVSFAAPRRDDGGSGIEARSAGTLGARTAAGDDGRAGRGGAEAWATEPPAGTGLDDAGVFPPSPGLAEAGTTSPALTGAGAAAGDAAGEETGADDEASGVATVPDAASGLAKGPDGAR